MAFTFRPSDELARKLAAQAVREHTSVQIILTRAAEQYLMRNTKRSLIDASLDDTLANYQDTLRALGEGA